MFTLFTTWLYSENHGFKEPSHLSKVVRKISTPCLKVFCQLRTYDERWYWQLYFDSNLTIVALFFFHGLVCYLLFKWWLRPSALFNRTNVIHGVLLTSGKHFHDLIISLGGKVLFHNTSLAPPPFIKVSVSSHESERSCGCVLGLSILVLLHLNTFKLLGFPIFRLWANLMKIIPKSRHVH